MKYFEDHQDRPLYRSRDGCILGVCKGIANYSGLSVCWIRIGFIILCFITSVFPGIFLYLLAAVLMKPEPVIEPQTEQEWEFYHSYAGSRAMGLARLKRKFDQLERRARRMESIVTGRDFDWEQRLRSEE